MTDTLSALLAAFATGPAKLSDTARTIIRLSALDWLAVGLAGQNEPVSRILRDMTLAEGGVDEASLFGSTQRLPLRNAALVNGTTSHALDYDDTHFAHIGHPSTVVFPAALAVAEKTGASPDEMLDAALIGAELSIRIGQWLGRGHYQVGFHQTATAGAFGAAAAAGRLLGLDAAQMEQVLGLAATRAAGLKAQFGTMGKPYNAGQAAAAGVEVAQLVAAGFDAASHALDGPFGYGVTHHGANDAIIALCGLGQVWRFETVQHKLHACCHGLHAALEAGRKLDVPADRIASIIVTTHPRWMSVCNQQTPMTGLGAKFSYTTVLAMQALGIDTSVPESYSDALCSDPSLRALRARVTVEEDTDLSELQARLTIADTDGAVHRAEHDLDAPQALDIRIENVRGKASALLGKQRSDYIWNALHDSDNIEDIAKCMRCES